MSKAKHTPGPWEAFTQSSFSGWWSVRDSNGREIGSGDGGFEIADARLIASAPELLEALRAAKVAVQEAELLLHKVCTEHGIRVIDDGDGCLVEVSKAADRMDSTIDIVVAAIAKATGETP